MRSKIILHEKHLDKVLHTLHPCDCCLGEAARPLCPLISNVLRPGMCYRDICTPDSSSSISPEWLALQATNLRKLPVLDRHCGALPWALNQEASLGHCRGEGCSHKTRGMGRTPFTDLPPLGNVILWGNF